MRRWQSVTLGEICQAAERREPPAVGTIYRQLGVKLWGEGAYERKPIDGADTKYSTFNRVAADDLVVNKIWARKGSVAVVPPRLAGCYVSPEFPVYEIDPTRILPGWMRLLTKWRDFWSTCDERAQGTSGKNRIKPQQFLSVEIPLPSLDEQRALITRFEAVTGKIRGVAEKLDAIEVDAERLLAIRFHNVTYGTPLRPMAEVAPLVRREVEINIEATYPELGIRSFGKGTFHKPPIAGAEVGSKRLYRIEAGDLLFSNVFAWEGAIAVAYPEDDGRFGSHRFISCEVKPDIATATFLRYYFLTPEGLEKIGEASPGGAGRNRTLGLEKLMAILVPVPLLARQQTFDRLHVKVAVMKSKHAEIRQVLNALLPCMFEQTLQGAVA